MGKKEIKIIKAHVVSIIVLQLLFVLEAEMIRKMIR